VNAVAGGLDLLNAELSVLLQSWPGFPGTQGTWNAYAGAAGPIQPGTIRDCSSNPNGEGCAGRLGLVPFEGGAVAMRWENGERFTLPGAHSPFVEVGDLRLGPIAWSAGVDGSVRALDPGCAGALDIRHPSSGDYYVSEMAGF
jgi:hypothetical protein